MMRILLMTIFPILLMKFELYNHLSEERLLYGKNADKCGKFSTL